MFFSLNRESVFWKYSFDNGRGLNSWMRAMAAGAIVPLPTPSCALVLIKISSFARFLKKEMSSFDGGQEEIGKIHRVKIVF